MSSLPATARNQSRDTQEKDCPPATLNGADWISSDAKRLMCQEMMDGLVPVHGKIDDGERGTIQHILHL
jgi:hypothetical protein